MRNVTTESRRPWPLMWLGWAHAPSRTWRPRKVPRQRNRWSLGPDSRRSRKPRCSGSSTPPRRSPAWRSRWSRRPSPRMSTSPGAGTRLHRDHRHQVTHDLIGEGDVVEKLQTQMQSGENIYDAYVNDSDLIGTHWRYQQVRNLTDWMAGEGADVTNPTLEPRRLHRPVSSPPVRTASSTSCPTSSSRTSTGSAMTGSPTRRTWPISRPNTATISACRSTGRPTRTSPSSSPAAT
jgi:hypothetical protein